MNFIIFFLFGNVLAVPVMEESKEEEIKEENNPEKWIDPYVGLYC